jgi:hypothetical protein
MAKIPSNTIPRQKSSTKISNNRKRVQLEQPPRADWLQATHHHSSLQRHATLKPTQWRHTHAQNAWCLGPHMKLQEGIPVRTPTHKFKTENRNTGKRQEHLRSLTPPSGPEWNEEPSASSSKVKQHSAGLSHSLTRTQRREEWLNILEHDHRFNYSTVMAPAWGMMSGSAASGRWEKYHVVGEHMQIANLFLGKLIKMDNFLWNFCWLDENSRCLDTR